MWKFWLGPKVIKVSRNGSDPCCDASTVNCMCGSWLLMRCRSCWLCSALMMTKVSSTNLSHSKGVCEGAKGLDFKLFHKQVGSEGTDGEAHGCTMYWFIVLTSEEELDVLKAELQEGDSLRDGHVGCLMYGVVL